VVIVPEYDQFYGNFSEGDQTLNTALLYAPQIASVTSSNHIR